MTSATHTPTRLTPETLLTRMQTASSPAVSPDGDEVVYVVSRVDGGSLRAASHLWLMNLATKATRQLTQTGITNGFPAWSPDGSRIAFISNRPGEGRHALCVLDRDGGEAVELETFGTRPSAVAWHPDGDLIMITVPVGRVSADQPKVITRIDYKQDNLGINNEERSQIVVVPSDGSGGRQITAGPKDHVAPQWSPDGRSIAVKQSHQHGMVSQIVILDSDGEEITRIGSNNGAIGTWTWSPDGGALVYDATAHVNTPSDYYRYDLATGESTPLTDDAGFSSVPGRPTISGPDQPIWLDDRTVLLHGLQAGASGLWKLDTQTGETERLVWWNATHGGFSADSHGQRIVQSISSLDTTGELVMVDTVADETSRLTHLNDALLDEFPLAQYEKITIDREGWDIDTWILKPADFDPLRSYPVILDVHGGPHGAHGFQFNAGTQLMAAAGYVVVSPNPRGSGTYGRAFNNAVHGDWGGEDWQDLQAALDAVLEHDWADGERTGIYGYSYGGFMTSFAIGHTDRFKAAVCGAPVFNFRSFYGTSDIGHVWAETQWGGPLDAISAFLDERSPSSAIHNATTPTLVVHGEADQRCPIGQGEEMFIALKKAGCEVEFVRYPDGSHMMLRNAPLHLRIDYYERVIEWFDRFLK